MPRGGFREGQGRVSPGFRCPFTRSKLQRRQEAYIRGAENINYVRNEYKIVLDNFFCTHYKTIRAKRMQAATRHSSPATCQAFAERPRTGAAFS